MKTGLSIKGPNKCDKTLGSEQLLKIYIRKTGRDASMLVSFLLQNTCGSQLTQRRGYLGVVHMPEILEGQK